MLNYLKKNNLAPDIFTLSNGSAVSPTSGITNVSTTDLDAAAAEAMLRINRTNSQHHNP
jgi:hypothetical protein